MREDRRKRERANTNAPIKTRSSDRFAGAFVCRREELHQLGAIRIAPYKFAFPAPSCVFAMVAALTAIVTRDNVGTERRRRLTARWLNFHLFGALDIVLCMFYGAEMDWEFAIERHREPLLRIVVGLFAMIGLTENGAIERVSRPLYRLVLGILRPAESAVRRLIIVAARDIVVEPRPKRPFPAGRVISRKGQGKHKRGASFKLFDPRKRNDGGVWPPAQRPQDRTPHSCLRLRSQNSLVSSSTARCPSAGSHSRS